MEKNQTRSHAARVGTKFFEKVEKIKDARLRNGKSRDRVSSEKITNLIIKHKLWPEVEKDIINATKEEVEEHGTE